MKLSVLRHCEKTAGFRGNPIFYFHSLLLDEIVRWNPKQIKNFSTLKKDIKNSTKGGPKVNNDIKKPFVDHFDTYNGKNGEHLIEVFNDGRKTYYFTKDIPKGTSQATSLDSFKDTTNILPQSSQNLNSNLENISKKPSSFDEWLEELKRKRKFRGR